MPVQMNALREDLVMTRYSEIARSIRRVLTVGAMTVVGGVVAVHAQEQAGPAEQQPALQTVIVTGSIIKRTDFETPSPVQVMTAEDLQQSGYTSVSDVLRNLSANGQGTLSQSFGLAFAGGGSGVALRGLTVGGTLTLVDSDRMIPYPLSDDGQRNFVDITAIPFSVVDHIDVLKDGASAEYGSDAIAGVVNVVLKKTFTGMSLTAEGGSTQHGDGTTEHISWLGGVGELGSDGYNAFLAIEYRHQDNILLSNRQGDWTNLNWTGSGGYDTRYGAYDPVGNPLPGIPGGYVLNPATNVLDATTHFLDTSACAGYTAYTNNQCLYNTPFQIQPQTGNIDILGRATKNLGGDWQAVFTGSLFRSEAEQVQNYPFLNGLSPTSSVAYGPGVNPYVVTTPAVMLPVGAPNNPFSAPAALIAEFPQLGAAQDEFVTSTYRFFFDVRGSAAGFDIDATAGYMYAAMTQKVYGSINPGELATAASNGFNFATASAGQMASAFAPEAEVKDTNTMQVGDVHAARELGQLPGGALSMAIGVGMYHLYKNSPAPATIAEGLQTGNGAYAIGGQTDGNAYIEFVAPLFKGFEFDAAGRYDHYNEYGSSTTPKFGVKYTPIEWVTFRGTYGKGFRAPNPAESGSAAALFGGLPFNDSALCPNPGTPTAKGNFPSQCNLGVTGLQVSTPDLQPEKSTNWTAGVIFQPFHNTSISFDYWNIKVNQDIQSGTSIFVLSGYNLALFPIVRGSQATLPFCTANGVCTTPELTPVGLVAYQAFPYFNATTTTVNGLDMDLASHFDLGPGRVTGTVNYSHMFHYDFGLPGASYDLAGTHGPSIVSGDTGNPKDRATASLAWDQGPWNMTASLNFVGRFNLTDPTAGDFTCEEAIAFGGLGGAVTRYPGVVAPSFINSSNCEVKHFADIDLYSSFAFTKSLTVHGSILNVTNSAPPLDLTTYGGSGNDPYNPAMHQAGAVGRFFNVGATYTF
jgi:iron complex outermembrane receptor protein